MHNLSLSIYIYIYIYMYVYIQFIPASLKKHSSREENPLEDSLVFQSIGSEAGEPFLPLACMAKVRLKDLVYIYIYIYTFIRIHTYIYIYIYIDVYVYTMTTRYE